MSMARAPQSFARAGFHTWELKNLEEVNLEDTECKPLISLTFLLLWHISKCSWKYWVQLAPWWMCNKTAHSVERKTTDPAAGQRCVPPGRTPECMPRIPRSHAGSAHASPETRARALQHGHPTTLQAASPAFSPFQSSISTKTHPY